jgi:hypothetical protein
VRSKPASALAEIARSVPSESRRVATAASSSSN